MLCDNEHANLVNNYWYRIVINFGLNPEANYYVKEKASVGEDLTNDLEDGDYIVACYSGFSDKEVVEYFKTLTSTDKGFYITMALPESAGTGLNIEIKVSEE